MSWYQCIGTVKSTLETGHKKLSGTADRSHVDGCRAGHNFGVAVPGIGLDATFAANHPSPG